MKSLREAKQRVDLDPHRRPLHHEPAHARQNRQLSRLPVDCAVKRLICDCLQSGFLYVQSLLRGLPDLRVTLRLERSKYRQRSARGCGAAEERELGWFSYSKSHQQQRARRRLDAIAVSNDLCEKLKQLSSARLFRLVDLHLESTSGSIAYSYNIQLCIQPLACPFPSFLSPLSCLPRPRPLHTHVSTNI